jgi:hypothetical protein
MDQPADTDVSIFSKSASIHDHTTRGEIVKNLRAINEVAMKVLCRLSLSSTVWQIKAAHCKEQAA